MSVTNAISSEIVGAIIAALAGSSETILEGSNIFKKSGNYFSSSQYFCIFITQKNVANV